MFMIRLATVAALLLTLVPVNGRAAEPYVVPVIISMTGPNSLIGNIQLQALTTFMKAVNDEGGINGRPLKFDFLDDGSNTATTVQIVSRLKSENVPLIVGPSSVPNCRATAPLVTAGPVDYCMSTAGPIPKGGYSFDAGFSTYDSARVAMTYAHQRGWHRVALLVPTDSTGQDGEDAVDRALALPENHDISLVAREHFNLTDISLAAQITHIQAANPNILIVWTAGAPLGIMLHALQYSGYDVPVLTSYGNLTYAAMAQFGNLAPKSGLYFTSPRFLAVGLLRGKDRAAVERFINAFKKIGVRPDGVLATQWDVGIVVADTLRHVGPNPTADQIRRYIDDIHGLPGAAASFDFAESPQRGIAAETVVIARWDPAANTFVAVSGPGGKRR